MFSDLLSKYDLPPDTEDVPPKKILQFCVEEFIERDEKEDHTDLKKFLDNVIPYEGKKHFIYIQDEEGTTYNFYLDRYDCIHALCKLSEHKMTVYFHPTTFSVWTKDKFAVSYRCIYIDIDDVPFPFTLQDTTKENCFLNLGNIVLKRTRRNHFLCPMKSIIIKILWYLLIKNCIRLRTIIKLKFNERKIYI